MRGILIIVGILLAIALNACGGGSNSTSSSDNKVVVKSSYPDGADPSRLERWRIDPDKVVSWIPPEPYYAEWDLGYGRNMALFGHVELSSDSDNLYVKYVIDDPTADGYNWGFSQTHLWIGTSANPGAPYQGKKGNWIPGQFPFKFSDPGQEAISDFPDKDYSFAVPWDWIEGLGGYTGECDIFVMTHCTIKRITRYDEYNNPLYKTETGWGFDGENPDFPPAPPEPPKPPKPPWRPPTPPPYKQVNIPDGIWRYQAYNPGSDCYWNVNFNLGPGGAVDPYLPGDEHNPYKGWCVDASHTMYNNTNYNVYLFSSVYNNPWQELGEWDNVNWMINEKRQGNLTWGEGAGKYNYREFQAAIWWLLGEYSLWNYHASLDNWGAHNENLWQLADAQALYNSAVANGDGYYPAAGEWFAVILYSAPAYDGGALTFQVNIIEVDP